MPKASTTLSVKPSPTGKRLPQQHENYLTDDARMSAVIAVAEILERGERSTESVMTVLAKHMPSGTVSRPTAIKYRNAAMLLIQQESKPMNRDNIRALEQGRYTYLIEKIYKRILLFEESQPQRTDKDWLKWHDTYTKLLQRLDAFGARLHAITGLNEITINNGGDSKRIVFVRPNDKPKDKDIDQSAPIGIAAKPPDTTELQPKP